MDSGKTLSPAQMLAILEAVIRESPNFVYGDPLTEKELRWLGRADAILEASGAIPALLSFRTARHNLGGYSHSRDNILIPLHDAYSRMELLAPIASQGAFIPAGATWNGYAALIKLVQTECNDLLIVDPYLNASIFTDFAPHATARHGVRCLTARRQEYHLSLLASAGRWATDTISQTHQVDVRYVPSGSLHDRLIIIDNREVWLISQSFKDIAKRSPASVTRADMEMSLMKAQHYEALWDQGTDLS